jgi:uncharacterized peroxidase-related enzyme
MKHHRAGLARLTPERGESFAHDLSSDYTRVELSFRERALLDYAAKLTRSPGQMKESDLDALRQAGLSDRELLDANLVVAYFAYVNRIADGLGVQVEQR